MSVDCVDGEPVVVYSNRRHRARKDHKCDACRETIRRGDIYFYLFAVWDGSPDTTKRCARCEQIYQALCVLHREEKDGETAPAWALDCGDSFQEVFDREPPPELAELAFLTADEMQARLATRDAQKGPTK